MPHPPGTTDIAAEWMQRGVIDLLGRSLNTGWPPRWQTPETGEWPSGPSSSIGYYDSQVSHDIKYVWELQRHQYLPAIATKHVELGDSESASELIDIMLDWGECHPLHRTVAWMEGIEVSLRLISWFDTISRLSGLLPTDDPRVADIGTILAAHASWLRGHLSRKWRLNNNHLLLELVGLIVAGHALGWHPSAARWRRTGLTLMAKELQAQTMAGRNWEPTTAYHRFVTEAILVARWSWLEWDGERSAKEANAIDELEQLVQQHLDTLWLLCDERNRIPLVGDDDAGVVIARQKGWLAPDSEHVFSFAAAQALLPQQREGAHAWRQCSMGVIKQAGFHVHLVAGAPEGVARQASHRHLDFLSCTVTLHGSPVLIDPGTFTYFGSRSWRDSMRRCRVHPTVWSKKGEFAAQRDLFEMPFPPLGEIEEVYGGLKARCSHPHLGFVERAVILEGDTLVIRDEGDLAEPCWSFPIPKEAVWQLDESTLVVIGDGWRLEHTPVTGVVREVRGEMPEGVDLGTILAADPIDGVTSSGYGRAESGLRLEVEGDWTQQRTTTIRHVG